MKSTTTLALAALLAFAAPAVLPARTKLVALPERTLLLTSLENSTQPLLMEEREIPLQRGTNHIDFSWKNVQIHPKSVDLEIVGADDIRIISTGFPRGDTSLTWEVYSPEARAQRVRVSYLLNGIQQETSYEMQIDAAEKSAGFRQHLLIGNRSGEDLTGASFRAPFLGSVERSLRDGETRRFLTRTVPAMDVEKLLVARPSWHSFAGEDGETISLVYTITNTADNGLGGGVLPAGKVRVFSDIPGAAPVFLGEDNLAATAPGDDANARLGTVRDVVLERFRMADRRTREQFNNQRRLVLFDQVTDLRYTVKNFKDEPVTLRIHETLPASDWEVKPSGSASHRIERKSASELIIEIDLPPAPPGGEEPSETTLLVEYTFKNKFPGDP